MLIPTVEVKINPGRRTANPEHIKELAKSISKVGLLNPIMLYHQHVLIAGLQAELAEIDENFIRNDLTPTGYGDMLLHWKAIYESFYPEARNGGDRQSEKIRSAKCASDSAKSFVYDTAEKLGSKSGHGTESIALRCVRALIPDIRYIVRQTKHFSSPLEWRQAVQA